MLCSSSGVAKISIAQNINALCKRLTPLLAVLISSECARAERGVPAVGVCTYSVACICNVGYAGKEVALGSGERCTGRGACTCSGGLSWQLVYLQGGVCTCSVGYAGKEVALGSGER